MKIILILLTLPLMSFSCGANQTEQILTITYSSTAMSGFHEEIKITADSIWLTHQQRRTKEPEVVHSRAISKSEWNNLLSLIQGLSPSEIATLESPTMARAYDGAMHSEISIKTANDHFVSQSFDDDNPHQKLQPLMDAIRALANSLETTKE